MALYDYIGALRQGRKQYQLAVSKGEYPYLPVLDQILANTDIVSEVNLGVIDVPLEKIVGTKTQGRTEAFAGNFMPLLGEKTEFGAKWAHLYDHQVEEGIHDPIVAYEFMNRYYVQEGNKRVSVLKYVHAYSISASVIRLIPRRTDDKDIRLYYEFLDFYQVSFNSDVWFSEEGRYNQLLEAMGKKPDEVWTEDERQYFKSAHDRFTKVFEEKRSEDMEMTASDAFLDYVTIYGYEEIKDRTADQMTQDLNKIWEELLQQSRGGKIAVVQQPEEAEAAAPSRLMDWFRPSIEPEMLKLGFIYARDREHSSRVYSQELGRMYLEQCFDGRLKTAIFENAETEEQVDQAIEQAVKEGCNVIFATMPQMALSCVKSALDHPSVRFFNCSVNISYTSIYTYYTRIYEAKFLMGALAAAMSDSEKLGYLGDFPSYGRISSINAFAMGARMINPRAKVYLRWSGIRPEYDTVDWEKEGIRYISGNDMITPNMASREFGLFHRCENGKVENLATTLNDWGKFYERIVRLICRGALDSKDLKGKKAVNFWWGMSADVLDVVCTENLPQYTKRLIRFLKSSIRSGSFQPFEGPISAQNGIIVGEEGRSLTPEEIVRMDWLAENIVGEIPPVEYFRDEIQPQIRLKLEHV
ncbi:BMP family ABC transporter substrate-binding protein [Brotaphodocola sp.]|uniref:BMP family ABC transporter substrate-binding protein n=1 Tax=Brotaphodocola sp. TaxID=3073577 RepID=UPI003D7E600A